MVKASVLLLDDDAFTRTTLSSVITNLGYRVDAFGQASPAVESSRNHKFDLALLDIDLGPGPNGIDVGFVLRRINPNIGLIFLTSYSDPRFVASDNSDLPAGSRYLIKSKLNDMSVLEKLIEQTIQTPLKTSRRIPRSDVKLTKNQLRILELVASGKSTHEIAETLKVSEKSVEAIISRINANLGISDTNLNKRVKLTNFYYRLIGKL